MANALSSLLVTTKASLRGGELLLALIRNRAMPVGAPSHTLTVTEQDFIAP